MQKYKNILIALAFINLALIILVGFLQNKEPEVKEEVVSVAKPSIALSTYALYDIAKNVGEDKIDSFMILPFGVSAHSFEPTPKLMAKIQNAKLVVFSGAGLEPWVHGFTFGTTVLDMSKQVNLIQVLDEAEHDHHDHDHHHHGAIDPHYWLDIDNMIIATKRLTQEFSALAPDEKAFFEQNRDVYIAKLETLDKKYKQKFSTCQNDTIITNHNAFSYLAARYHFHTKSLKGISPESQPSPQVMIELINHVKKDNINTIFFETFVSDKAMRAISSEANVAVERLSPLGNISKNQYEANLGYLEIMESNLAKISKALECR